MILKIKLIKYNKNYPKYFQREKRFLKGLGKFEIHHIGSTAIPKIIGKNIIDILVIVKDKKERQKLIKKLKEIDYIKAKVKDKNRIFFSRINNNQEYNLHLVLKSYKKARDQIKFKDYIKKHPNEFKNYLKLKKDIFKKSKGDRVKYRKLKEKYFNEIMKRLK